jgi:hypothetical protein
LKSTPAGVQFGISNLHLKFLGGGGGSKSIFSVGQSDAPDLKRIHSQHADLRFRVAVSDAGDVINALHGLVHCELRLQLLQIQLRN